MINLKKVRVRKRKEKSPFFPSFSHLPSFSFVLFFFLASSFCEWHERWKSRICSLLRPLITAVPEFERTEKKNQSSEHQVLVCHSGSSSFLPIPFPSLSFWNSFPYDNRRRRCFASLICLVVPEKQWGLHEFSPSHPFFSSPFHFHSHSLCRFRGNSISEPRDINTTAEDVFREKKTMKTQETNGFFGASHNPFGSFFFLSSAPSRLPTLGRLWRWPVLSLPRGHGNKRGSGTESSEERREDVKIRLWINSPVTLVMKMKSPLRSSDWFSDIHEDAFHPLSCPHVFLSRFHSLFFPQTLSSFPCLLPLIMALSRQSLFSLEDTQSEWKNGRGTAAAEEWSEQRNAGRGGESRVRKVWRVIKDHGSSFCIRFTQQEMSSLSLFFSSPQLKWRSLFHPHLPYFYSVFSSFVRSLPVNDIKERLQKERRERKRDSLWLDSSHSMKNSWVSKRWGLK